MENAKAMDIRDSATIAEEGAAPSSLARMTIVVFGRRCSSHPPELGALLFFDITRWVD